MGNSIIAVKHRLIYKQITGQNDDNDKKVSIERLYGLTRIDTSKAIAEKFNSTKLDNVIVATGLNFPDALAGSILAKKLNAPVLLTGLTPIESYPVIDYISKHLDEDGTVYILGGQGAVNETIVAAIRLTGHNNIVRLEGLSRYQTNKAINDKLNAAKGTPIVLATGKNFPDALSISSIAAIKGYPIVLTEKDSLPSESETTIKNIQPSKIYVIGVVQG